jgi:hypothetical protein
MQFAAAAQLNQAAVRDRETAEVIGLVWVERKAAIDGQMT